jgi:hypothetical protein
LEEIALVRDPISGKIAPVKIIKIGALMACGGAAAVVLGAYLGVGSCNATSSGILFLRLGLVAAPIGIVTGLIGVIIKVVQKFHS